jgi:hypothetical protein
LRKALLGLGIAMVAVGGVWTLQGIGLLGGSFMTGQSFWTAAGLLTLLAGAIVCVIGLRGRTPGASL